MKWIKRVLLAVVFLILIAAAIIFLSLNSIIRSEIEQQGSASLGVTTTLSSARLSLLGGSLVLSDLQISSPPAFSSPRIFTLGSAGVAVQYGQLARSPIHIQRIFIDHPVLAVEQANAKLNLKALFDQMPQTPKTSGGQTTSPIKLIIDDVDLNNAEVTFLPGIGGIAKSAQVNVPSLSLKNIGNANGDQNGAAIKDVVMQLTTALAAKATDASKLPPAVKLVLAQELNVLSKQLGSDFDSQFQALAPGLTEQLSPKLEKGLQKLLGGKGK